MEDRQRLEALVNELNTYQGQAEVISATNRYFKCINWRTCCCTRNTLKQSRVKRKKKHLVPIGAGSFLITELKNTEDVIIGLGAGVAVKKKIDDAKVTIEEQKTELEQLRDKMTSDLQQLSEYIRQKNS